MTARKHFKQLVRERMRKTGERYTVARRHVEGDAGQPGSAGGVHGDTAAFANVLANLGVLAERRAALGSDDPRGRRRAGCRLHPVASSIPTERRGC